jgi:hypothetical protein
VCYGTPTVPPFSHIDTVSTGFHPLNTFSVSRHPSQHPTEHFVGYLLAPTQWKLSDARRLRICCKSLNPLHSPVPKRKYPIPAPLGVPAGLISFSSKRQSCINQPTHNGLALIGIACPAGPCIRSKCLLQIRDLKIRIKGSCKNSLRHTICCSPCDNAVESCALLVVLLLG